MRRRRIALAGALLVAAGCYAPDYRACAVRCSVQGDCADGTSCALDGYCHADDESPAQVCAPPLAAAQVSAGGRHSCAIDGDGALWCWGSGAFGQLGLGAVESAHQPQRVGDQRWESVSAGEFHTCAVRDDHTLWCWGDGADGRLGLGPSMQRTPQQVDGASWRAVSAGTAHTCGVRTDGALLCWGFNQDGQIGDGTADQADAPIVVSAGFTDWQSVSAGRRHTCAVRESGALLCWGGNPTGQLGVGTHDPHPVAIAVAGTDWVEVTAGGLQTCGRTTAGALLCWGAGVDGALGNGGIEESPEPAAVSGPGGWSAVDTGESHTCGIRGAGELFCWGANFEGQLGFAGALNASVPMAAQAGIPGPWVTVSAGLDHSCGARDGAAVSCWGRDDEGQLGD